MLCNFSSQRSNQFIKENLARASFRQLKAFTVQIVSDANMYS